MSRVLLSRHLAIFPSQAYAVLAPVSQGYSPPRGRLPTCYSPVRRCTHGLLHFLARLACVRRAASVDSEPGSNSRLMFLLLNRPACTQSSDEVFLTASNQIVNDLRSVPITSKYDRHWQASKLVSARVQRLITGRFSEPENFADY